ncbi:T6SS phospholipase effector Tle1-like catalytic domain-containing protein [Caballeronia grimmiae]|uniref:T6SS phospholipase effector Tle1-like catalytic domain-containing protein n=1 Tax=Caballeronia grimmiae TaxID=1071679 RepID=UPI0038BD05F7
MNVKWPEQMPEGGRLAESEAAYKTGLASVVDPVMSCPQTLHVTLFFDGTNNNNDEANGIWRDSVVKTHSNVARLFNAALHQPERGIFRWYIPGVGTPFEKIGEECYSSKGKALAAGFDPRCVWGYTRLLNSVYAAISTTKRSRLIADMPDARKLCDASGPVKDFEFYVHRLGIAHKDAVNDGRHPKTVKKIWVNVIGFSRGAACARAFVHKLINEWAPSGNLGDQTGRYALPYEVNFVGLFDTVASVDMPDSMRSTLNLARFTGHSEFGRKGMAFAANGAMNIPDKVRACHHVFSIHEQRMSFPLDSIRKGDHYSGGYRVEVAYPGVHSDVGGGYGPGEQGKGCDSKGKGVDARKLSQIPLHDMYIAALTHGVPLETGQKILELKDRAADFAIDPAVVQAFNAWRRTTPAIKSVGDAMKFGMEQMLTWRTLRAEINNGDYITHRPFYQFAKEDAMTPHQVTGAVEAAKAKDPQYQALSQQLAEAKKQQTEALSKGYGTYDLSKVDMSETVQIQAQIEKIEAEQIRRSEALTGIVTHPNAKPGPGQRPNVGRPGDGPGDFGTNDQTDLRQSAEEMRLLLAYLHPDQRERWQVSVRVGTGGLTSLNREKPGQGNSPYLVMVSTGKTGRAVETSVVQHFNVTDDVVFEPVKAVLPFIREHTSDAAVEKFRLQRDVVALYDDYVHDSRCWFRVPWFHEYAPGGYFWPRVVFVGNDERTPWLGIDPLKVAFDTESEVGASATAIA